MSDIAELLERCRKAAGPDRELDALIFGAIYDAQREPNYYNWQGSRPQGSPPKPIGLYWAKRANPITASIDAITALIERELPGLVIKATKLGDGSGHWQVQEAWIGDIEVVNDFSPMEPRPGALAFTEVFLSAKLAQVTE